MPRPRQRACLEEGLKLNLNKLMRDGCIAPNARTSWMSSWTDCYTGGEIAHAYFTARVTELEGSLLIRMDESEQSVVLTPRPRHFGGQQWYFVCTVTNRLASVLWMPLGASRFCSRHAWGNRRVAYASQFLDRDNRAHRGKAKIKKRLIGDCDPDEWDLPPKPKWMRWRTYNRYVERFDAYEANLDSGIEEPVTKLLGRTYL